jgi:hypothetical protein
MAGDLGDGLERRRVLMEGRSKSYPPSNAWALPSSQSFVTPEVNAASTARADRRFILGSTIPTMLLIQLTAVNP